MFRGKIVNVNGFSQMFTSGGGGQGQDSQNQFIGMAMSEASKLFDQQQGQGQGQGQIAPGTDKQSATNSTAKMALSMYMKNQGGDWGGLMSLASKFM
jgi:hypothetical protein